MANVKTAVSLQEELLEQVDALANEMKVSRSRVFMLALKDYLLRHENQQLLEKINRAYQDAPDADEQKLIRKMQRHQRKVAEGEW